MTQANFNMVQVFGECGAFRFWDSTGAYDAVTNPGGLGSGGSHDYDDVDYTDLIFVDRNNVQYYLNFGYKPIDNQVRITAPMIISSRLDQTDAAAASGLIDGTWSVQYRMIDANGEVISTKTKMVMVVCNTRKRLADLSDLLTAQYLVKGSSKFHQNDYDRWLNELALAQAKFNSLISGKNKNETCINDTLDLINNMIKPLLDQCR